jgi:hypothetical protein
MRDDDEDFENEARRIARALWPGACYSGAVKIDGRERDGLFETEECIHLLEATTSRKREKARDDIAKLISLASKLQRSTSSKAVRCWFVTRDEPTADQRQVAEKHRSLVTVLAFSQFQARLIDVRAYLAARDDHAFGSVRDPVTGSLKPATTYVPLALAEPGKAASWTPDGLVDTLSDGGRVVLLGDYGAGKSMTLHYLYRKLATRYKKALTSRFPVYINLRDHYGQTEPAEILERHARMIGFEQPAHLVRAWRAGYVHLLLDGFDEITTLSIQGLWRKLKDNRFRAMEPVRRLTSQHPARAGMIVAGRAHFFDTDAERRTALGLGSSFVELSLSEFSDAQLEEYLTLRGVKGAIPQWLPSRPLLVAYLASRGLIDEIVGEWAAELEPAAGWDMLLERIATREAQIEAGIDGPTVRRILERLATKSRASADGLAPLTSDDIVAVFKEVCGYPPDDRGMLLLQRLPGLGIDQGESETRRFIDESFAETCRAGDVVAFAENPYDAGLFPSPVECCAGPLGVSVAAGSFLRRGFSGSKLTAAIERAVLQGQNCIAADLVAATIESKQPIESQVYVKDVLVRELDFAEGTPSAAHVHFQDCIFGELGLDPGVDSAMLPRFHGCFIATLEGRVSATDLPAGVFEECLIESFSSGAGTTNEVLDLPIPLGVRVLITVLRKLFERKGRGRKENALYRGLDHRARRLVPEVLQLIKSYGLAYPCRRATDTIWMPDRSARAREGRIAATPSLREDPLVVAASDLK